MRKTYTLVVLCICMGATPLYASFEPVPTDPRSIAMSGSLAAVPGDAFTMRYNPAAPSLSKGVTIAAAESIPYGDSMLTTVSGAANWSALPFDRDGAVYASVSRFAPDGYRELTVSAGYARRLSPSIHVGVSASRMSIGVTGMPDRNATGINAGIMAEFGSGLILGAGSFNINSPKIGADNPLPRTTLAGLSYRFENGNLLTANAQGDPDRPGRLLAAGEFWLMPSVVMMMGTGTNPSVVSAGAGIGIGPGRITAAVSRNIDLGTTAAFGIELVR
ncbi:MAG: hypothetical protein HGB02_04595 [Chlorobiaceae bacterium]|nr:hypothetical protein [Chlorobiaceae bacterium]